ncbi:MAG: type II toxin-antitoxin system RatA family toxin [Gammaproteobacteria bacterium]
MRSVRRRQRVSFSAEQMFDLVDDIERYPDFLPWCQKAIIKSRTEEQVEASVEVGLRGISKEFSTRNRLERPRCIDIQLIRGPFRKLEGAWTFDATDQGCEIALSLDFEVSHSPLNLLFSTIFEEIVRSQVAAFTARAEKLYG